MKHVNPRNKQSLQTECHTCLMLGGTLQRSNIINEPSSTQATWEKRWLHPRVCHSRPQMVARVSGSTIITQEEDWKDSHFQMHTRESCSNIPIVHFASGPTGQHTVLLTSLLGVRFFCAVFSKTLFVRIMSRNTLVLTHTSFPFLWIMLYITMYEEWFIVPEQEGQNEVHWAVAIC